jgi:hypothetical protein
MYVFPTSLPRVTLKVACSYCCIFFVGSDYLCKLVNRVKFARKGYPRLLFQPEFWSDAAEHSASLRNYCAMG